MKNSKEYSTKDIFEKYKGCKTNSIVARLIHWGQLWTGMISNLIIGLPVNTTSDEILKRSQSRRQIQAERWLAPLDRQEQMILSSTNFVESCNFSVFLFF